MKTNKWKKTQVFFCVLCIFCMAGLVELALLSDSACAGPNSEAGCAVDMGIYTHYYSDEITKHNIEPSIAAEAGQTVFVMIVAQNVTDLDTYEIEALFDPTRLKFIQGFEENQFDGITNILKKFYGTTLGFQAVCQSPGKAIIANTLVDNNRNEAPEGSGVLAILEFETLDAKPDNFIQIGSVHFVDSDGNNDVVTKRLRGAVNGH
jgi:hypothetical protein